MLYFKLPPSLWDETEKKEKDEEEERCLIDELYPSFPHFFFIFSKFILNEQTDKMTMTTRIKIFCWKKQNIENSKDEKMREQQQQQPPQQQQQ